MKRLLFLTIVFLWPIISSQNAMAYNKVRLIINDGISNPQLKQRMEQAVSAVMTEVNRSYDAKVERLQMPSQYMSAEALNDLNRLWANDRFRCVEGEVVERCLTTRDGYQIRGIPLIVRAARGGEDLGYQEAVFCFDGRGVISNVFYTIAPEIYSRLRIEQMSKSRNEVTDIRDRMMILEYVEHFRTAYNQKDLQFLNQVFSEDALIITGRVIKTRKSEVVPTGSKIVYTTQTKRQYLENLARAFRSNSYIKVAFDDVKIVEHPTIYGIYGVTVHQRWNSSRYSDEGYVFMMWDFRNPDLPQIHVRTWQPDYIDKAQGKKLDPDDVFTLGDFDL